MPAQIPPGDPKPTVYWCPRSCHEGRVYESLDEVKAHVTGQHPEYDPHWADDLEETT